MAPFSHDEVVEKPPSSGSKFTIIFVAIIVTVLLVCVWWGCILPKWRKKHPARPSPTRFNGLGGASKYHRSSNTGQGQRFSLQHPPQVFPSHPAVMHHMPRKPTQEGVKIYNPRTQTPFPNSPPMGDSLSIPSITPRPSTSHGNLRDMSDSQGLFSPVKPTANTREDFMVAGAKTELTNYAISGYGDATDYILAIPEPLLLKPKSAGRPPPLAKQLEKFPLPVVGCHPATEKLAHPKKLFAELDLKAQQSSDFEELNQRSKWARTESEISPEVALISASFVKPRVLGDTRQQLKVAQAKSFKSARGVFTNASTSHVTRAGTITRPKTPVADIRDLYDRAAAEVASQSLQPRTLKRNLTPSTEPLTSSSAAFSPALRAATPPTSVRSPEKRLPMLPTPLRLRRQALRDIVESPTPDVPRWRSYTPSSAALPESPDKLGPLRQTLKSRRQGRKSIGFYHRNPNKARPAPLRLPTHSRTQSLIKNGDKRISMADLLSPFMFPHVADQRSVAQGSSRYSRDTKGVSIVHTPTSADFPTPTQPNFTGMAGDRRLSSFDLVRFKIDGWNLHTADLQLEQPPSLVPLKRTLSDLGPRSPDFPKLPNIDFHLEGTSTGNVATVNLGLELAVPRICVGRANDDIFTDQRGLEQDGNKPPRRLRDPTKSAFSTSDSNLSSVMGRPAPGNAEWI